MSTATVKRSTRLTGDPEATEATLRPSVGLEPQAIALETKHLSRSVVERVLVSDIGVGVQPGDVLAVVGPSGSGKSSFPRLLNRLDEPTGGTVYLNGQDYRNWHRECCGVASAWLCRSHISSRGQWPRIWLSGRGRMVRGSRRSRLPRCLSVSACLVTRNEM